jgi:hypothetical protein
MSQTADRSRVTVRRAWMAAAALLGIAVPAAWLATSITPGEEAVKVRNSLVARMGTPEDFNWLPEQVPAGFLYDEGTATAEFRDIAAQLANDGAGGTRQGFELGLEFSRYLMSAPRRSGGPIQSNLAEARRQITTAGRGYCADFTQVFTALATAATLPVRRWSISFGGFGAGHTFNEVYDVRRHKWTLVDAFHSLYFVDPTSGEPLSVLEIHDRLLALDAASAPIAIRRIVPQRFPFRSEALALDYYRRGMSQLAMVWGSNSFGYDQSKAIRAAASVSRHLERAVAIAVDQYPDLVIYPIGVSERDVAELHRTRQHFLLAAGTLVISLLVFGWQLLALWKRQPVP